MSHYPYVYRDQQFFLQDLRGGKTTSLLQSRIKDRSRNEPLLLCWSGGKWGFSIFLRMSVWRDIEGEDLLHGEHFRKFPWERFQH